MQRLKESLLLLLLLTYLFILFYKVLFRFLIIISFIITGNKDLTINLKL